MLNCLYKNRGKEVSAQIAIKAVSPDYTKTDRFSQLKKLQYVGPVELALTTETRISGGFFDRADESSFD